MDLVASSVLPAQQRVAGLAQSLLEVQAIARLFQGCPGPFLHRKRLVELAQPRSYILMLLLAAPASGPVLEPFAFSARSKYGRAASKRFCRIRFDPRSSAAK